MKEYAVRIEFLTPCLGSVKRMLKTGNGNWPVYYLPRVPDDQVRFENSWWKSGLRFAANVLGRHQDLVDQVAFAPEVSGQPVTELENFHRRYLSGEKFVRHECFDVGSVVEVQCVIPLQLPQADLEKLLNYVGRYRGISPYRHEDYGKFRVLDCREL